MGTDIEALAPLRGIEEIAREAAALSEKATHVGEWKKKIMAPGDELQIRVYDFVVCKVSDDIESVDHDNFDMIAHTGNHYGTLAKAMLDAIEACRMAAKCEPGWLERVKAIAGVE